MRSIDNRDGAIGQFRELDSISSVRVFFGHCGPFIDRLSQSNE
jgi:hypothetical protein